MKKEVTIKYEDSRVLALLKDLSKFLGFTISEKEPSISKEPNAGKRKPQAVDFANKWAGFLRESNTDNSRYDYLTEKYK